MSRIADRVDLCSHTGHTARHPKLTLASVRGHRGRARAADPWDVLTQATIEGATAIGLGELTGSLEADKRADVVTISLEGLHTTPIMHGDLFNVAAHIVFSASGRDVRDVWIDGRRVLVGGVPQTFDVARVRAEAQAAAEELFERRAKVIASA